MTGRPFSSAITARFRRAGLARLTLRPPPGQPARAPAAVSR